MSGDYLTKLRQKPKHVRDNIAFGLASTITGVIALFLIFAVHGPNVVGDVANKEAAPEFFKTLMNQAKEQVAATKASMKEQSDAQRNASSTNVSPAANGSGAAAPAVLLASSSPIASSTPRTVLIATTSSASLPDENP